MEGGLTSLDFAYVVFFDPKFFYFSRELRGSRVGGMESCEAVGCHCRGVAAGSSASPAALQAAPVGVALPSPWHRRSVKSTENPLTGALNSRAAVNHEDPAVATIEQF